MREEASSQLFGARVVLGKVVFASATWTSASLAALRQQSPMAAAEPRDPLQVNARPQALPALPRQTLKPRVRGACSRACSTDPSVQKNEAVVDGALFLMDSVMSRGKGYRLGDPQVQRLGGRVEPGQGYSDSPFC